MNLTPVSPRIGAVAENVVLDGNPDPDLVFDLRAALAKHLVLVIENQDLSALQLKQFVSHFGPLFIHHSDKGVLHADGLDEVLEIRKNAEDTYLFGGADWHADVTFRKPAGYLSVLHALVIPDIGGDTGFSSTISAFDALSTGMQDLLRGLNAVHSYDGPGQPDHPDQTAIHAVVRTHPQSGKEGIYLNRMFATRFQDMSESESRPLIDYLDQHMSRPEFTCRVRWKKGNVVIWDNRFTLHYPINDFTGQSRLLIRCTALESCHNTN
jgi:taurine dioxygenase